MNTLKYYNNHQIISRRDGTERILKLRVQKTSVSHIQQRSSLITSVMPHHPSQLKVFAGTMLILGFCAVTFYGPKQKADGHNLFDVSK